MNQEPPHQIGDAWISEAVLGAGQTHFHDRLWAGLRTATGADHMSQLTYDVGGQVRGAMAVSWQNPAGMQDAVTAYKAGYFCRDPNYPLMCQDGHGTLPAVQVHWQPAAKIVDEEYRQRMFDKPGFIGKVALIGRCAERIYYLNFYFSDDGATVARTVAILNRYGVTLTSLSHHHDALVCQDQPATASPPANEAQRLSARERQVVHLLREGNTAKEIGKKALDLAHHGADLQGPDIREASSAQPQGAAPLEPRPPAASKARGTCDTPAAPRRHPKRQVSHGVRRCSRRPFRQRLLASPPQAGSSGRAAPHPRPTRDP